MTPMDQDYIEQHDIAQRYQHGRLTPEEQEGFELFVMQNPDVLENLELDSCFSNLISKEQHMQESGTSRWKFSTYWKAIFAPAAAFVLGLSLQEFNSNRAPHDITAIKSTELAYISKMRDGDAEFDASVFLSAKTEGVVFVLQPDRNMQADYEVLAFNETNKAIWPSSKQITANSDGDLVVIMDQAELVSNSVRFEFKPLENDAKKELFNVKIYR